MVIGVNGQRRQRERAAVIYENFGNFQSLLISILRVQCMQNMRMCDVNNNDASLVWAPQKKNPNHITTKTLCNIYNNIFKCNLSRWVVLKIDCALSMDINGHDYVRGPMASDIPYFQMYALLAVHDTCTCSTLNISTCGNHYCWWIFRWACNWSRCTEHGRRHVSIAHKRRLRFRPV